MIDSGALVERCTIAPTYSDVKETAEGMRVSLEAAREYAAEIVDLIRCDCSDLDVIESELGESQGAYAPLSLIHASYGERAGAEFKGILALAGVGTPTQLSSASGVDITTCAAAMGNPMRNGEALYMVLNALEANYGGELAEAVEPQTGLTAKELLLFWVSCYLDTAYAYIDEAARAMYASVAIGKVAESAYSMSTLEILAALDAMGIDLCESRTMAGFTLLTMHLDGMRSDTEGERGEQGNAA